MAQTVEYFRQYRARKKKAGLCRACKEPVQNRGGTYCAHHIQVKRAWNAHHSGESTARSAKLAQEWSAAGVCVRCGRERSPKRRFCLKCLVYKRERRAAWRLLHGMATRADQRATAISKATESYLAAFPRVAKDPAAVAWVKAHPEIFKDPSEGILYGSMSLDVLRNI